MRQNMIHSKTSGPGGAPRGGASGTPREYQSIEESKTQLINAGYNISLN